MKIQLTGPCNPTCYPIPHALSNQRSRFNASPSRNQFPSPHFKFCSLPLRPIFPIGVTHAAHAMNKVKRHSPPTTDLRPADTDSDSMCRESLMKFKNARRRRLQIRRMKYTCETKIHVAVAGGESSRGSPEESKITDSGSKGREIRESMEISLSLRTSSSSSEEEEDRFLVPNDAVLAAFGGQKRKGNVDLEKLSYGSVSVMGSRKEMEDAVSIELGFVVKERGKCDFFAVFDGHGGPQVAKACRERLHRLVAEEMERYGRSRKEVDWDWEGMMEGCFGRMDREMADNAAVRTVGSTAVVAVVAEGEVVVANCGDSRAVMGRGGEAVELSNDHKPNRPDELMRIEEAGGRVINWNGHRVLGVLATSRSIGDQHLRPYVISKPEVTVTKRTIKDEFLILASDGLWNVISSDVACQIVRKCLNGQIRRISHEVASQSRSAEAAALLAEIAMAKGSRDNTSVIVVELRGTVTSS